MREKSCLKKEKTKTMADSSWVGQGASHNRMDANVGWWNLCIQWWPTRVHFGTHSVQ